MARKNKYTKEYIERVRRELKMYASHLDSGVLLVPKWMGDEFKEVEITENYQVIGNIPDD